MANVYTKDVEYVCLERVKAKKKCLEDGKKEKQQESPAKEVLDKVRRFADTDRTPKMMRFGFYALKTEIGRSTKELSKLK